MFLLNVLFSLFFICTVKLQTENIIIIFCMLFVCCIQQFTQKCLFFCTEILFMLLE